MDLEQDDRKLQTIFNIILTEFHKYSNYKAFSVQLKQCNKNRIVAKNLKNALQEYSINQLELNQLIFKSPDLSPATAADNFHFEMFSIRKINDKNTTSLHRLFPSLYQRMLQFFFFRKPFYFINGPST